MMVGVKVCSGALPKGPPRGSLPYLEVRLECWRLTRGKIFVPSRHQSLCRRGEGGWPFVPLVHAHEAETSLMVGLRALGDIAEVLQPLKREELIQ